MPGERLIGLLPTGKLLADLHIRRPASAQLFDQRQSVIIGECRFEPLQTVRQVRNAFPRRDVRERKQMPCNRKPAFQRREQRRHFFPAESLQSPFRQDFGNFQSLPCRLDRGKRGIG
ncbi:hypothetical protein D3C86_1931790 [compost metagenome]